MLKIYINLRMADFLLLYYLGVFGLPCYPTLSLVTFCRSFVMGAKFGFRYHFLDSGQVWLTNESGFLSGFLGSQLSGDGSGLGTKKVRFSSRVSGFRVPELITKKFVTTIL